MSPESWLKIGLPAFPFLFTVLGAWAYWGDNPLPLLPSPIAFWGLVILFYLFTHLYIPNRRYPLAMTILVALLWLVASITSHNLGRFVGSGHYSGVASALETKDFWYAYICAGAACLAGVANFLHYEPLIVSRTREDRATANLEE